MSTYRYKNTLNLTKYNNEKYTIIKQVFTISDGYILVRECSLNEKLKCTFIVDICKNHKIIESKCYENIWKVKNGTFPIDFKFHDHLNVNKENIKCARGYEKIYFDNDEYIDYIIAHEKYIDRDNKYYDNYYYSWYANISEDDYGNFSFYKIKNDIYKVNSNCNQILATRKNRKGEESIFFSIEYPLTEKKYGNDFKYRIIFWKKYVIIHTHVSNTHYAYFIDKNTEKVVETIASYISGIRICPKDNYCIAGVYSSPNKYEIINDQLVSSPLENKKIKKIIDENAITWKAKLWKKNFHYDWSISSCKNCTFLENDQDEVLRVKKKHNKVIIYKGETENTQQKMLELNFPIEKGIEIRYVRCFYKQWKNYLGISITFERIKKYYNDSNIHRAFLVDLVTGEIIDELEGNYSISICNEHCIFEKQWHVNKVDFYRYRIINDVLEKHHFNGELDDEYFNQALFWKTRAEFSGNEILYVNDDDILFVIENNLVRAISLIDHYFLRYDNIILIGNYNKKWVYELDILVPQNSKEIVDLCNNYYHQIKIN